MFSTQCTQPSVSYWQAFKNSRFIKNRLCIHSGEADYFWFMYQMDVYLAQIPQKFLMHHM